MKFIAGNIEFTDNMKQLLPDMSIFNRIISDEPTILQNNIWRKQMTIPSTGISSGSVLNTSEDIFYRSCYLIYKSGADLVKTGLTMTVKNVNTNETLPTTEFSNWGVVQVEDNLYMLFVWIDLEQSFVFNSTTNAFNSNDWFIQVVI